VVLICLFIGWLASPLPGATLAANARARITVDPGAADPGSVVLVTGDGFQAGETVNIRLDGKPAATVTSGSDGVLPVTGLVLPLQEAPGVYVVQARGAQSGRTCSAMLIVTALNPTLIVRSGPTQPGARVAVHGAGFLPREEVALALNGGGLSVIAGVPGHPGLLTGPDGEFDAAFIAPSSLLAGANTLSATGSISHRAALATLTAHLPVRTDFLFAGAETNAGQRPMLALLNAGRFPAMVRLTLYPETGTTLAGDSAAITVAAESRATVALLPVAGSGRRFGLRVQADRRIAAQLLLLSAADQRSIGPAIAPRMTWYFAEGFTGLTFRESLTILNPGRSTARLRVHFLLVNGRQGRTLSLDAPPHREVRVDVNRYVPRASVATIVEADRPVVAGRTLRFGGHAAAGTTELGSPLASSTWLFADGSTVGEARTFLTILNPASATVLVTASFYDDQGRLLGNSTLQIGGRHRGTLAVNGVIGAHRFATFVTASAPVVVERPMYRGDPNGPEPSGTDAAGSNGPSPLASFADGAAGSRSREEILVLNPTARTARIACTVFPATGASRQQKVRVIVRIPPLARHTIDVAQLFGRRLRGDHATLLQSLNGVGFVAEQAIATSGGPSGPIERATQALVQ
jgi:hypothetical protein